SFPQLAANEKCELRRRESLYRGGLPPLDIAGRHVVLVDDGIDTASSMLAAIRAAKKLRAASVTVAAPVATAEALKCVSAEADRVVILEAPPILFAIAEWYERFGLVEDIEVCELLARAARRHPFRPPGAAHT
ncbi:MAG TPA: phosphoribosyltransferase family protein, partial [Steroidobacteraceae bacterium]